MSHTPDIQRRVEALEQQALTATSPVRMNLTQLGIIIGSIAAAVWWASLHVATKDDVKTLEERLTASSVSLRDVTTTLAVLKDRSDRQTQALEDTEFSKMAAMAEVMSPAPAAPVPTTSRAPASAAPAQTATSAFQR